MKLQWNDTWSVLKSSWNSCVVQVGTCPLLSLCQPAPLQPQPAPLQPQPAPASTPAALATHPPARDLHGSQVREVVSILHTMDWTESNLAKAECGSSRLLRTKPFLRTSSKGNRQQGHFQKCVLIIAVLPASQESHCWPRANREKKVL